MDINRFLAVMVDKGGSDMFFSTGAPVHMKIEGVTHALKMPALQPGQTRQLAQGLMNEVQAREFAEQLEMNLALTASEIGRFRVNIFMQRGEVGIVVRHVKSRIASLSELGLPPLLEQLVMRKRGLVLVVGATGSGKSTTLASMIDYRNRNASGHILTIEDPIEFLHAHHLSVVDQREVGIDTHSYEIALKNALREAPDVIMIGEIRDRATMQQALAFSETGHLCLSTLHANSADQALERIVNLFPDEARMQMLQDEFAKHGRTGPFAKWLEHWDPDHDVFADRVQIQQAVINLALNAMEAMSDAQVQPRRVSVSIEPTTGWIAIAVRDRGPGIAPGQMAQLFDPFFTTKRSGMGLGLSIVRTLVEAHGGRVRAENRASGGAVFHVELPAAIIADVAAGSRT